MSLTGLILTLAIVAGQLIKITFGLQRGTTVLDLVVLALCAVGLLKAKFKLKYPPNFIKAALIFLAVATISLLLTPLKLTPVQYIVSFSYTIRFAIYVLLAWLIYSKAISLSEKGVYWTLLSSGVALAILGLLQLVLFPDLSFLMSQGWDPHYFRTVTTFLDPNFAGAYFVLTLLVLTAGKVPFVNFWKVTFFALTYLALLTTFSRGSYLVFITGFTILALLRKSMLFALLTIILTIGLFWGYSTYHREIAQPRGVNRQQSAQARVNTWDEGWQLFRNHPLLGVGFNSYQFALKEYNLVPEQALSSRGSTSNDSSLLFVASTTGIIGLIIYVYFLLSLVRSNYSQYRHIIIPAILGLLVHSFFANSLFYPPIIVWILLISVTSKK